MTQSLFQKFKETLPSAPSAFAGDLIGHDQLIETPFGKRRMIYADYVASGRALMLVESFILKEVLPLYANSHTEASYVGGMMTRARREARDVIRDACNAGPQHAVIFTGSGATAGLNRLVHLLGLPDAVQRGAMPAVLIGPYEHHSNILPWRESGADVIEIPEAPTGGPDLDALNEALAQLRGRPVIGAFSAASNVTGILTDVTEVTRRLKAAGARVVWDYAGGGPYIPIDLRPASGVEIDAIVLSPHKFIGGPQASGVLILHRDAVQATRPTLPGGGTVRFVSPTHHDYSENVEAREEAGTPNVIGDLRAGMVFMVKEAIGQTRIATRNRETCARALRIWGDDPNIEILGNTDCQRLPILSFRIRDGRGGYVHQQLVTRLLSDHYGIQARGGCACAGPYVHQLLGIDADTSEAMRTAILEGNEIQKPGFVRLNFSYLASDEDVDFILNAVRDLATIAGDHAAAYQFDPATAIFTPAL